MTPIAHVRHAVRRVDLTRGLRGGSRLVTRFGVVGVVAVLVDVGVFNLMRYGVDLGPLTSKTVSVLLATTVSFVGNLHWTFGHRRSRHAMAAYALFFVANGIGLLIALACLGFSSYVLGLASPLSENIASNVVGLGLGTLFRFWAYHRWVFRDVGDPNGPSSPSGPSGPSGVADIDRAAEPARAGAGDYCASVRSAPVAVRAQWEQQ